MDINYIKKRFLEHDFTIKDFERENEAIIFTKGNLEFRFINQRFDGWELYFKVLNSSTLIKIDFTLKMFATKISLKDLFDEFENKRMKNLNRPIHEITIESINGLIFNYGIFLIKNQNNKIKEFTSWHEEDSDEIYRNYLKELKTRKIT